MNREEWERQKKIMEEMKRLKSELSKGGKQITEEDLDREWAKLHPGNIKKKSKGRGKGKGKGKGKNKEKTDEEVSSDSEEDKPSKFMKRMESLSID